MPEGAALRFDIKPEGSGLALEVRAGAEKVPLWRGSLDLTEIDAVLRLLPGRLKKIHDRCGNALDVDPVRSAQAVDDLLDLSYNVASGLFKRFPRQLYEATAVTAAGALNPGEPARVVEVGIPAGFSFPFELLRWRDLGADDLPADPAIRVRALLGMSGMVRRHFSLGNQEAAPAPITNRTTLPVTVFRNTSLKGARQEVGYFDEARALVEVYGPWPDSNPLVKRAAAMHIVNSLIGIDSKLREEPVAVMHLACHCRSGNTDDDKMLRVGGPYGDITLADLKNRVQTAAGDSAPLPRPLVFLNACASATHQMDDRTSFVKFLMDYQYRGVLGTLYDISDTVASHFAMVFYEALLKGSTVGQAMHEARWHLMDRHRNPLGLLYTFHGNVDLKVARPRKGGVPAACEG